MSVIIPVYNRGRMIGRAIRSVLAQTLRDIEVLVVDDCSTDDTGDVVRGCTDARVTYLAHVTNRGGSAARNTGIAASTGAYIAFLDSDDEWLPDKLEKQVALFEAASPRVGLVATGEIYAFEDGRRERRPLQTGRDLQRELVTRNVVGSSSTGMIRRSVIDVVSGFDEALPSWQDIDFWLRIAQRFEVAFVPEHLSVIHKHSSADRITLNAGSQLRGRQRFCEKHAAEVERHGLLHVHLRDTGRMYQSGGAANMPEARRWYRASIDARPRHPLAYVLLAGTYLPSALYRPLLAFRRQVIRVFSRIQRARTPND